jgi:pyridoxamine 5'-phosphate oxidase
MRASFSMLCEKSTRRRAGRLQRVASGERGSIAYSTAARPAGRAAAMATDPFALFDEWLAEARASEPNDPEAMAVATADEHGNPSVRMVLLKAHGPGGFTFYTNEQSLKGRELAENPNAALLFHWKSLRRQVRIEGEAERVPDAEADAYFASRGRDSQLGAWASDQSRPLASRAMFEARLEEMKARFAGADVPRPPHWGGFRVVPLTIEFWKDRPSRLHERRLFTRLPDGGWDEGLLYP